MWKYIKSNMAALNRRFMLEACYFLVFALKRNKKKKNSQSTDHLGSRNVLRRGGLGAFYQPGHLYVLVFIIFGEFVI